LRISRPSCDGKPSSLADHRLESLGLNIDQAVIVRPHGAGWDKPDATVTG
jgi:hypothetical protein